MRKINVFDSDWTIEILADGNPKRGSSQAYDRFDKYLDQGTIAENLRRGLRHQDLVHDQRHGYIKLVPPTAPAAAGRRRDRRDRERGLAPRGVSTR